MIFKKLSEYLTENVSFSIGVSKKKDVITVSVAPIGALKYPPLLFSGTAEQIDAEFLPGLEAELSNKNGWIGSEKGILGKSTATSPARAAKKEEPKKEEPKKPATSAPAATSGGKKKKKKPVKPSTPTVTGVGALAGQQKTENLKPEAETEEVDEMEDDEITTTEEKQPQQATGQPLSFEKLGTDAIAPPQEQTPVEAVMPEKQELKPEPESESEEQPTLF